MAGWEQLTREQLLVVVAEQAKVVEEQSTQIEALTTQVAELTRRLGRNSGSSSMPPSSDRGNKPQREPRKRGAVGRKPGKPGAPGAGLGMVADPDVVYDHEPDACAGCGADLAGAADAGMIVRQVRDVPLVKITITEHRLHKRACGCGRVSAAKAPPGVTARPVTGRACARSRSIWWSISMCRWSGPPS